VCGAQAKRKVVIIMEVKLNRSDQLGVYKSIHGVFPLLKLKDTSVMDLNRAVVNPLL
jgi:hypothetical protein